MLIENILHNFGVPKSETNSCLRWALGDGCENQPANMIDDLWRTNHPDLTPVYASTEVNEGLNIIATEYLKKESK